jgi:hypothetical protein
MFFSLIPAVSNHTHLSEGNLSIGTNKKSEWIIDSGASDHMTYYQNDFCGLVTPRRLKIINANGEKHPVTGARRVSLTPSISLSNTLLVPSLSSKLLSVGQISDDLKRSAYTDRWVPRAYGSPYVTTTVWLCKATSD